MGIEPVPDKNDVSRQMVQKIAQESNDGSGVYGSVGMKAKAQGDILTVGMYAECGNRRDFLMGTCSLAYEGRFTSQRPTATYQWRHKKATLINEDYKRVELLGFFLIRGH